MVGPCCLSVLYIVMYMLNPKLSIYPSPPNFYLFIYFVFYLIFILYWTIVLISGVQQSDSVIHIYIFFFFRYFSHVYYYRIIIEFPVLYSCCLVAKSCPTLLQTPWTVALQTLLSLGFPRQEYWRGMSFPFLGYLPDPEIKLGSPALTN